MSSQNKQRILLFLCLFVAIVLQNSLVPHIAIGNARPELPLLFVVLVALFRGSGSGAAWGAVAGLLLDLLSGKYLGMHMLALMAVGMLCGMLFARMHKTGFLMSVIATAVGALIYSVLFCVLAKFAGISFSVGSELFGTMLPMLIYTALLSLPFYLICSIIVRRNADNLGGLE